MKSDLLVQRFAAGSAWLVRPRAFFIELGIGSVAMNGSLASTFGLADDVVEIATEGRP